MQRSLALISLTGQPTHSAREQEINAHRNTYHYLEKTSSF